jgi:hypothetical protein
VGAISDPKTVLYREIDATSLYHELSRLKEVEFTVVAVVIVVAVSELDEVETATVYARRTTPSTLHL